MSIGSLSAQNKQVKQLENDIVDAVGQYNEGKIDEAALRFRKIIEKDAGNDAAHYYLGLSEFRKGNTDVAEAELRTAVGLDSTNFWYRYRLATVYSLNGKEELTLAMFESLIRDFPKKYDLYYSMAELYMSQNQSEKALETLDQIENVFGKNEMTTLSRFDLLRKMQKEEEAYAGLEKYNEEYSSPQILSLLGDRQLSMYNDTSAIALYNEALDLAPDYAPAILGKAETYRMTRKYDEYFSLMQDFVGDKNVAVEGKCSYLDMLVRSSGATFLRIFQSQMDSLIVTCEKTHPEDSTVNWMSGGYFYGTGREAEAKVRFKENMDNYPGSIRAAASYAELLMYMKDWEGLVKTSLESYDRFSSQLAFLELASMGEYNLGHYDKVIEISEKIIASPQTDSAKCIGAYTTMGDMYYKSGEKKNAYKAYEKALAINPDYAPVLNNYAYFLSLDGKKLKKALAMSKKTVDKEPDNATYLDTYGWILFLQGKAADAKPYFKNAVMLYGAKENPEVLDHYAEVLYALGEYDLAFLYWNQAKSKNDGSVTGLEEKIKERKASMKKDQMKKKIK